jgi:uncharacterized protein YecE (DUF72 family)
MKCDLVRLQAFLAVLPDDVRAAFEFRHASWHTEEVYCLLEQRGVALCLAESDKLETPRVLTGGFVYSRLRKSEYSPVERTDIAQEVRTLLDGGRDCYVFFKHEESPAGAFYAEDLLKSMG